MGTCGGDARWLSNKLGSTCTASSSTLLISPIRTRPPPGPFIHLRKELTLPFPPYPGLALSTSNWGCDAIAFVKYDIEKNLFTCRLPDQFARKAGQDESDDFPFMVRWFRDSGWDVIYTSFYPEPSVPVAAYVPPTHPEYFFEQIDGLPAHVLVDLDWGSTEIWVPSRGGGWANTSYEAYHLPDDLVDEFQNWEAIHEQFAPGVDIPADRWNEFIARRDLLASKLAAVLGPRFHVYVSDESSQHKVRKALATAGKT